MLASSTLNFGSLLLNSPSHNPTKTFLLPPNQPFLKSSNPISKNSFLKSTRFSAETAVAAVDSSDLAAKEGGEDGKKSYHFVVANAKFMLDEEEHFQELMGERLRLYGERNMEQDFWLVIEPKFLDKFPTITNRLNRPAVALVSTNAPWITCVLVEVDNRSVVQMTLDYQNDGQMHGDLLGGVKELLHKDWLVELRHNYRESNFAPDCLASFGNTLPCGHQEMEDPLELVKAWLNYNAVGVTLPRSIIA